MLMKATATGGGRDVMFRLRVEADPSSRTVLQQFGTDIANAQKKGAESAAVGVKQVASQLKSGQIEVLKIQKEIEKLGDSLVQSAMRGKGPFAALYKGLADQATDAAGKQRQLDDEKQKRQMRQVNELHNYRVTKEAESTKQMETEFEKQVKAFEAAEMKKSGIAEREADRQWSSHRQRQLSIARGNRGQREALGDLDSYVGAGPAARPSGTGGGNGGRGGRGWRISAGAGMEVLSGLGSLGLMGGGSETILNGLLGIHGIRSLVSGLGGGISGVGAAGGAAVLGGGAGLLSAGGFARDVGRYGFGGGAEPGSLNSWTANHIAGGMSSGWLNKLGLNFGSFSQTSDSNRVLKNMQDASAGQKWSDQQANARGGAEAAANYDRFQLRKEAQGIRAGALTFTDNSTWKGLGINRAAQRDARAEISHSRYEGSVRGSGTATESERAIYKQREIESQRTLVGLLKQEQQLQRELTVSLQGRADAYRQAAMSANETFGSAKEKFGNLSQSDQQRAVKAKRMADQADAYDSTSPNGRSAMGDWVRSKISKEDRQLLGGIGTADATRSAKLGAFAEAERAGFNNNFGQRGGGEQEAFRFNAGAARAIEGLIVKIAPEMNIKVVIDGEEQLTDSITASVVEATAELNKKVEEKIKFDMQKEITRITSMKRPAG